MNTKYMRSWCFFINKICCTKNDATSHLQPKCNWMWHEIKSKKKMPVFYLVCSFNGCSCEMCFWNAPFECRFKWNHSNRFSSSTVINGNQHWHFHGCFHYFKKIFYTKFFILTFCLVVLSHLIQQFSSLLMLQHGIFRNPIIKVLFS